MRKPIKSTDPRKPAIVQALKAATGAKKITNVTEEGPATFRGRCLGPMKSPFGRTVWIPVTNDDGYQTVTIAQKTITDLPGSFKNPCIEILYIIASDGTYGDKRIKISKTGTPGGPVFEAVLEERPMKGTVIEALTWHPMMMISSTEKDVRAWVANRTSEGRWVKA
ncbi:MAG: hypothetical protein LLG93_01785 [Deltaproteobacteria bacterium]|nr:hypothetical protein [Deltaproteobacteria bacterium]